MNFKLTKGSLNFKVYTSPTIPASGTENDIVIISSTPMENWILSSDSPTGEPRNKGDVWIQYSVSGNVFDIMNQHDFMLAITKIYQYISGIWMTVDARRYVGGVWDVVSSAFSATISITYPANSNCVVANSGGQTVASDTNTGTSAKTWTATVNATGTYTVTATATDGSGKTKSTTVSITTDGQSASVTLTYELVLFNNGVVSGYAWDSSNTSSSSGGAQVSGSLINLWGTTWDDGLALKSGWGEIGISSAIGLSDYSTLKVHLNKIDGANGTATIQVGTTALGDNTATKTVTLTAGTTTSLDISSITGSKYISLYAQSNGGAYGNHIGVSFDKVWLE